MSEFFHNLIQEQDVLLRAALLTGLLAGIACGVVGSYVVTRRITYIAGSIAHCVLGGMGAARYFQVVHQWDWAEPMLGALAAALIAAGVIGFVTLRAKEREDTIIGAVWAIEGRRLTPSNQPARRSRPDRQLSPAKRKSR